MSKVITINKFAGMKDGGSYFLQGFQPAYIGNKQVLRQEWKTTAQANPSGLVVGFTQKTETGLSYVNDLVLYSIDNDGNIYKGQSYYMATEFAKKHDIQTTKSDLPDIKKSLYGNIIYTSAQYLGRRLEGTDNSGADNKATSMVDTSKNFVTEGVEVGAVLYNKTDKCKGIITSITTTTNTNDTLNCSAGFSGGTDNDFDNGDEYAVYADSWQDLGAEQAAWSRQIIFFENLHLIGNGNYLATIDENEANFNASYKQLRKGWYFRAGAENAGRLIITANKDHKGALMLWDGFSDGWNHTLYLDNEIDTIQAYGNGWLFNSGAEIYYTDGYTKTLLSKFPDIDVGLTMGIYPNGLLVLSNKVIFNYDGFLYGRAKSGIWVLDILTREWLLVPYANPTLCLATNGGLFFDPKHNNIYAGYFDYITNRIDHLTQNYRGDAPDQSVMIFPLSLGKERQINWIEVDWAQNSLDEYVYDAQTVDITVSVGDDKRLFWAYGQANAASDTKNTIKIDNSVDTYNKVAVGDEILMLNRNNKGERAFIQSISGAGTNACVLTLDRSLTNKTESSSYFNILPLRKADGTNTYTKVETAKFVPTFLGTKAIIELWVKQSNFPIQIEEIRVHISD